ncbi:MAG: NIPSNAP family protein [Bauldia litoralis]
MIVEERIYTLEIARVGDYLRLYEEHGIEIQKRILGNMVGYFSTEVGPLNQIIHMWGYDSFEDRLKRRAELGADPGWQAYVAKIKPFVLKQENKLLIPAPFSPIGGIR